MLTVFRYLTISSSNDVFLHTILHKASLAVFQPLAFTCYWGEEISPTSVCQHAGSFRPVMNRIMQCLPSLGKLLPSFLLEGSGLRFFALSTFGAFNTLTKLAFQAAGQRLTASLNCTQVLQGSYRVARERLGYNDAECISMLPLIARWRR